MEKDSVTASIPFSKSYLSGRELNYLKESLALGRWGGDGPFSEKCTAFLKKEIGAQVFLTPSATHALELAFMALGLNPGDEVILPSFTFVSTANSLVQVGLKPVFIDIQKDTLNMDEALIEQAMTEKTRAILPVHYAGVACEMDKIQEIAKRHGLSVVEDAAQGLGAFYKNRPLGTIGDMGVFSFHETKNVTCGEGGALVVASAQDHLINRVQIHRQKGTDRSQFLKGEIDKYSWIDRGSSYVMSDILAAFLYAQLESMKEMIAMRKKAYDYYRECFRPIASSRFRLPFIPEACRSNYHLFFIVLENKDHRDSLRSFLFKRGVESTTHFVPLHNTSAGKKYGVTRGTMTDTVKTGNQLLRLPLYTHMTKEEQETVVEGVKSYFQSR